MTARTAARAGLRALAAAVLALGPVLALAGAAAADGVTVVVDIPDGDSELRVTDAQLRWGLNAETGSGAFFGGCNFLSAGAAGDAGGARVWSDADATGPGALFRTRDGAVRIEKPDADGGWQDLTWPDRCQDGTGRTVTSDGGDLGTGVVAVIDGGEGTVDLDAGTARIQWRGSVTVVFYGGLTYWWLTDPMLVIEPDGTGTLTATIGGYGTSMDDLTRWERLSPVPDVVIATLSGVELGETGMATVPVFDGVQVQVPDSVQPQRRDVEGWGSFPQEFVDAQVRTGQAAYWYTSGGLRDSAKTPTTMWVSYEASTPLPSTPPPPSTPEPSAGGAPAPGTADGFPGSSGAGAGGVPPSGISTPPVLADEPTLQAPTGQLVSAPTWLAPGLIPSAAPATSNDLLPLGVAGVLGLSSIALVGFRSGWLVLPFSSP
ncbi:hypothetical protein [Pseudactinotalea suaedae]|uniref:hypothetical protein n=1 Tax=Pseudactinotalea suaedae TaxID=1524924 RepID=UPI0012E2E1B2|nr:hypothetical protein [Pseudactinotalea suaedae]